VNQMTKPTILLDPFAAVKTGVLPLREQVIRFAVGDPGGLTSNAWRVWTQGQGDIYLACRDSFQETKVSLHVSGRWRFGFTAEAANARPDLIPPGTDRAMEVWDKPKEFSPGVIQAFKLYFPISTLYLSPGQRIGKKWKDVLYIEEGTLDVCSVLAVYVTTFPYPFSYNNIRSFSLGIWALPDGTFAQLVAQAEPENFEKRLDDFVVQGKIKAQQDGFEIPEKPVFQFWGTDPVTGARFTIILPDRTPVAALASDCEMDIDG
jgi:hypothetical protein